MVGVEVKVRRAHPTSPQGRVGQPSLRWAGHTTNAQRVTLGSRHLSHLQSRWLASPFASNMLGSFLSPLGWSSRPTGRGDTWLNFSAAGQGSVLQLVDRGGCPAVQRPHAEGGQAPERLCTGPVIHCAKFKTPWQVKGETTRERKGFIF